MRTSERGIDLITSFEGFRSRPYLDAVNVPTIGFGHTQGVTLQTHPITLQAARHLLAKDLRIFERGVEEMVRVPLTQGQFDALVSFAYNVGLGALRSSTLLQRVNRRQWWRAWREFRRWDKAGGRAQPGLTRRRKAEARMFIRWRPKRRKP